MPPAATGTLMAYHCPSALTPVAIAVDPPRKARTLRNLYPARHDDRINRCFYHGSTGDTSRNNRSRLILIVHWVRSHGWCYGGGTSVGTAVGGTVVGGTGVGGTGLELP